MNVPHLKNVKTGTCVLLIILQNVSYSESLLHIFFFFNYLMLKCAEIIFKSRTLPRFMLPITLKRKKYLYLQARSDMSVIISNSLGKKKKSILNVFKTLSCVSHLFAILAID